MDPNLGSRGGGFAAACNVIDPAIESHYGTGYERARLFPGGRPSLEFVRSMELLARLLPPPPARLLDVGGGPGTYAAPLARRGYRVHLVDPVELHVQQARQAAGSDPAAAFTAAAGDARRLSEPDQSQNAVFAVRSAVPPDRPSGPAAGAERGPASGAAGRSPAGDGSVPVRFPARRAVSGLAG